MIFVYPMDAWLQAVVFRDNDLSLDNVLQRMFKT